jgi:hypothetical protein
MHMCINVKRNRAIVGKDIQNDCLHLDRAILFDCLQYLPT